MQPPPRKVKVTQELKNIQAEQMTKLQAKHQAECDLLEDMRTFSQKKAAVEREYAQTIQKLASQYLKKEWPVLKADERSEYRNIYTVWKSFLEGTMQVAQSRINICENYKNLISEPARTVKLYKEQHLKRCVDQLIKIQTELQETVKDLAKAKKKYFEAEQMAHAMREKADIDAKPSEEFRDEWVNLSRRVWSARTKELCLGSGGNGNLTVPWPLYSLDLNGPTLPRIRMVRSKLSLFQSRISLQKANVKLKARKQECNAKATHARNDYLLTLAAANAHQDRYYHTDLANTMKTLDGNVYDHLKDYLMAFNRTELETCQAGQNTFQYLLETSSRAFMQLKFPSSVMRDYNLQLFIQENPVFHKALPFQFQPCDSDTSFSAVPLVDIEPSPVSAMRMLLAKSRQLESETGTTEEHSLNKEARKWATRVAREHKNIIHSQRALDELERLSTPTSEQGRVELEQKIEDTRESIRKAEITKLKAEARLDLLRQIGVSVDTWLKSAMNQVMEELENERWASLPTMINNGSSHLGTADLDREDGEELEDSMDAFDDSSSSPSGTLRNYPLTCKVIYSYQASQPDELTIEEHEMLEVIEDGDMEDWVKLIRSILVVSNLPDCIAHYLGAQQQWVTRTPIYSHCSATTPLSIHYNGWHVRPLFNPYIAINAEGVEAFLETMVEARNKSGQVGYVPEKYLQFPASNSLLSMLQSLAALDSRSHTSSNSNDAEMVSGSLNGDTSVCFVKALYDYDAQTEDELSFPEGAIIRILNKENQDDDGFWEGEFNGRMGVFPSVLVEELAGSENGDSQWIDDIQVSPLPKPQTSLPPLPLYDQPPTSPLYSPDKTRNSLYFPRSPSGTENNNVESPLTSQPPRITPDGYHGKLRPVRAAPPPPTQTHRRQSEKTEDVEITLV